MCQDSVPPSLRWLGAGSLGQSSWRRNIIKRTWSKCNAAQYMSTASVIFLLLKNIRAVHLFWPPAFEENYVVYMVEVSFMNGISWVGGEQLADCTKEARYRILTYNCNHTGFVRQMWRCIQGIVDVHGLCNPPATWANLFSALFVASCLWREICRICGGSKFHGWVKLRSRRAIGGLHTGS